MFFGNDKNEVDFAKLGNEVKVFFRAIPSCDFMLGGLDVKPPEKKEKAKRESRSTKLTDHPVEKPQELTAATGTASGAKGENGNGQDMFTLHKDLQNEMSKAVKRKGRVGMFETVVDPDSFTQTVENIFALTFLVKDGLMMVEVDEDEKVPQVVPVNPNNELQHKTANQSESQFIATFSLGDWERIREEFSIQQGLMNHRELPIYDDARMGGDAPQ
jgi:hypothetical protein